MDFLETRGAGDVDLGDAVANHIHPGKQQAPLLQYRAQSLANFLVARRQGLCNSRATGGEVAPHYIALGNTRQAKRHGAPTDNQHALVTLGDGWDADIAPLGAVVRDDNLYGRGACDMKGGLACAIAALVHTLERVAADGALPRRGFSLICSVDEEDFMRGSEAAIDAGWVGSREWVLDTEPTDGQIQVAHKGRTWFEIEMTGVTAHASQPWKGADAVAAIAEVVCSLRRAFMALPAHDELGPSTITFGQIEGGYRPYVVPDRAKVWVDMRLTPPTDTAAAINMVEHAIAVAEAAVPGCHGSYTVTGDRPAIERDPNSPLLAALKRAADDVTDADTTVGFFTGYTDTAVIAGKTGNRNCMSYGPGSLALAHKPDEYVPHADIVRCQNVLIALADNTLWDASGQVGA